MEKMTRREFLVGAAAGAAGLYASAIARPLTALGMGGMSGGGGGCGGGGGSSTSVINPPVGTSFKDPSVLTNRSDMPGVVEYDLDVGVTSVNINGATAKMMTYNGFFPGATMVAERGDMLRVNLKNSLPMSLGDNILGHPRYLTNLHTHGLHVSPAGMADNVMRIFMPGETGTYEYDLSLVSPGTLNFYHPHIHGTVGEQVWAGLAGGLVIKDEVDVLAGYETHALVLKDIALVNGEPAPHSSLMTFMHGLEGDTVMVNGQVNPKLSIRPGQVQRWRIVNASNARFYKLSLEGHPMHLIGTDGGLLDKPYRVTELLMSPGERVDLLIQATQPAKSYRLLSMPYNRGGSCKIQTVTMLTLAYSGSRANDAMPAGINPDAKRVQVDSGMVKRQSITLSMGQGKGYVNGIAFLDHEHCATIHSMLNTYEIWDVYNAGCMDHPFHQHTNSAQVLSITGGDAGYASLYTTLPAWKDVVIIPKNGKATLLVPVMDYAGDEMGMPMIHCHIPEHEDIGMMAMWHIMDEMM
jgi:FtsP/CotA-like multicopper oxidase with cupredoxin domain